MIHSYSENIPCAKDWNKGITYKLQQYNEAIDLRIRYLDAKYWSYEEEKEILRNLTDTIVASHAALVITQGDEATASFLTSGHSRAIDIPVLAMGIQYPNLDLLGRFPHVFGYSCIPDFSKLLEIVARMFPGKKEIFSISDDGYLSTQAAIAFRKDWEAFVETHPGYTLDMYDASQMSSFELVTKLTYPRYVGNSLALIPKWSPFISVLGKNSKCPFFAAETVALCTGAYAAYAPDAYELGLVVGELVLSYLHGRVTPSDFGLRPYQRNIMQFDYKQLQFFHTPETLAHEEGKIINISYYDKYRHEILITCIVLLVVITFLSVYSVASRRRQRENQAEFRLQEEIKKNLLAQKEEFDNIFHSMSDCMATYTVDAKLSYVNYTLSKLVAGTQIALNQIDSTKYKNLNAGTIYTIIYNDKKVLKELIDRVLQTKEVVQIPNSSFLQIVGTNRAYPIAGSLFPIYSNNKITGVALSFRNIAEEEINKNLFDLAVKNAHIIPWRFTFTTGEFTFPMNSLEALGYGEMTSMTRDDLRHKVHPDDIEKAKTLFDGLEGTSINTFQIRLADIYGRYHWFEVCSTYMEGIIDNHMSYNIVGVCQNIQQYKESEEILIEARTAAEEADKMKTAFLANMSHEIRTPLNAIVGLTSVMPELLNASSKEELQEVVDAITINSDLLLSLVRDVMELSTIQSDAISYTFNEFQLNTLLSTVQQQNAHICPQNVEFALDIPCVNSVNITTDESKLNHVLTNLLSNAFKFTSQGYVKLGYDIDKEANRVVLYVEDTGCGISEKDQPHIFERFYKSNEFKQGTGLGLSICQIIVDNLGGEIKVYSTEGKGSRFEVHLPG